MRQLVLAMTAMLVLGHASMAHASLREDAKLLCTTWEKWQKRTQHAPDQRAQLALQDFDQRAGEEIKEVLRYLAATDRDQRYAMLVESIRTGSFSRPGVPGWKCEAMRYMAFLEELPPAEADWVLAMALWAELRPKPHAKPETYEKAFLETLRKEARSEEVKALLAEPPGERAAKWARLIGRKEEPALKVLLD